MTRFIIVRNLGAILIPSSPSLLTLYELPDPVEFDTVSSKYFLHYININTLEQKEKKISNKKSLLHNIPHLPSSQTHNSLQMLISYIFFWELKKIPLYRNVFIPAWFSYPRTCFTLMLETLNVLPFTFLT